MEPEIVESARMSPAVCICSSHAGPFADTKLNHPMYGWIYICERCVGEIAAVFGFETPAQVADRVAREEALETTVADLEASLEEARAARVVPIGEVVELVKAQLGDAAAATKSEAPAVA